MTVANTLTKLGVLRGQGLYLTRLYLCLQNLAYFLGLGGTQRGAQQWEKAGFGIRQTWIQISALPLKSWVTLGSHVEFPVCKIGGIRKEVGDVWGSYSGPGMSRLSRHPVLFP